MKTSVVGSLMLGRRAVVQALIDEAIASEATFLIIAGDVFDGDWRMLARVVLRPCTRRVGSCRDPDLHR